MSLRYRKLARKDCHDIINLWMLSKLPIKPNGRDTIQNLEFQIELPRNAFLGSFSGDKLVGVAIASHNGRKGWINRVAVAPEYQNQGIASRLIQQCEQFFLDDEIKIFACLVEEWNEKSKSLFEKSGYTKYHEISYYTKRMDSDF